MKSIKVFSFATAVAIASLSAHADSIFDYTVYTKEGVLSARSNILGDVGSGGPVDFLHFLIAGNIHSATRVSVSSGTVQGRIVAPDVRLSNGEAWDGIRERNPFARGNLRAFANEMDKLSARLAELPNSLDARVERATLLITADANRETNVLNISAQDFSAVRNISFSGQDNSVFVINISGQDARFSNQGILIQKRNGESPLLGNIIFNFVNAKDLLVEKSGLPLSETVRTENGTQSIGIPGTILAPYADVIFREASLTGAIFAKTLSSVYSSESLQSVRGGQINSWCFAASDLNIGCYR